MCLYVNKSFLLRAIKIYTMYLQLKNNYKPIYRIKAHLLILKRILHSGRRTKYTAA